jgi:hypothetical protein
MTATMTFYKPFLATDDERMDYLNAHYKSNGSSTEITKVREGKFDLYLMTCDHGVDRLDDLRHWCDEVVLGKEPSEMSDAEIDWAIERIQAKGKNELAHADALEAYRLNKFGKL